MAYNLRSKPFLIASIFIFISIVFIASTAEKKAIINTDLKYPEGSIVAELDSSEPISLPDGTKVTSLLESSNPGFLEIGIRITGPDLNKLVYPGEFTLVTDDGRTFTPTELIEDGDSVVFSINAQIGDHTFQVRWTRANIVRLILVDKLPPVEAAI
jgi:hypothetical protein